MSDDHSPWEGSLAHHFQRQLHKSETGSQPGNDNGDVLADGETIGLVLLH